MYDSCKPGNRIRTFQFESLYPSYLLRCLQDTTPTLKLNRESGCLAAHKTREIYCDCLKWNPCNPQSGRYFHAANHVTWIQPPNCQSSIYNLYEQIGTEWQNYQNCHTFLGNIKSWRNAIAKMKWYLTGLIRRTLPKWKWITTIAYNRHCVEPLAALHGWLLGNPDLWANRDGNLPKDWLASQSSNQIEMCNEFAQFLFVRLHFGPRGSCSQANSKGQLLIAFKRLSLSYDKMTSASCRFIGVSESR